METPSTEPKKRVVPRQKEKKGNKRARIIIRNLSFKATEEAVTNWFARYGEIQEVKLLRKPSGDLVGCAFVQYSKVPFAATAIKECNAKPFLGRPIAIDWAVPKQQYTSKSSGANESVEENHDETNEIQEQENPEQESEVDDDTVEVKNQIKSHKKEQKGKIQKDSEEDSSSQEDGEEDESEDEELNESNTDEEQEDSSRSNLKSKGRNHDKKASDWVGHDSVEERKSDVDEGKTVFIRNLDFSTSQESFKDYMATFGDMHYALLCMDKIMERPRGTAFVKFKDRESAEKCIEASKNMTLQLDGRTLDAVVAVSRQDLEQKRLEKTKEKKDNRNLYLAREGMIRPGTKSAQGVSTGDMARRQQNEIWKKQMLRNLHMFISRERLCIHNLPPKMTDKQLKKLFLKHSPKGAKITEARIMRDLKKVVDNNMHPSKGYGFVTYTKHEDALQALRNINNNPSIFTPDKRPIVEFSVENRAALKAKVNRTQKSREKSTIGAQEESVQSSKEPQESMIEDEAAPEFSGAKANPKIKGLPSHSGPKIRHRKRDDQKEQGFGGKKPKITRKMFKNPAKRKLSKGKNLVGEPVKKKMKSTKDKTTRFDRMVSDYQKSQSNNDSNQRKKKWFDS